LNTQIIKSEYEMHWNTVREDSIQFIDETTSIILGRQCIA